MAMNKKFNASPWNLTYADYSKGHKVHQQVVGTRTTSQGQDKFGARLRHDFADKRGDFIYVYAEGGNRGRDGNGMWSGSGIPGSEGHCKIGSSKAVAAGGGGGGGGGGGFWGGQGGRGGSGGDCYVKHFHWDKTGFYEGKEICGTGSVGRGGMEGGWFSGGAGGGGGRGGYAAIEYDDY